VLDATEQPRGGGQGEQSVERQRLGRWHLSWRARRGRPYRARRHRGSPRAQREQQSRDPKSRQRGPAPKRARAQAPGSIACHQGGTCIVAATISIAAT
jgi:hypothetical protein